MQELRNDIGQREPSTVSGIRSAISSKPIVVLPGGSQTITETAGHLAELFSERQSVFLHSGVPVMLKTRDTKMAIELEPLIPAVATTEFEDIARLMKLDSEGLPVPAICSESCAKRILLSRAFRSRLPVIDIVTRSPVLTPLADGSLTQIVGYNEEKRIFACGQRVDEPDLDKAIDLINLLLRDFDFATPGDRSRAIASLITPALVHGFLTWVGKDRAVAERPRTLEKPTSRSPARATVTNCCA